MELQHELIITDQGMPFKLFLFEGGNGNYVREKHWHTSIEIFAVMEGRLSLFLNDREYPLKQEELVIINSNEIHWIQAPEKNCTLVLQIPLKQFEDYFTAERFIRFTSSGHPKNKELAGCIRRLYEASRKKEIGCPFQILALYNEIMFLLVSAYRITEVGEKEVRHSRKLDALSKITTYMREHYREDLRLSDLAAMFGYSDAYLSRMFQKYARVNFKTYLQDIRMAYAYRELMTTDDTISTIALNNGFCSSRGFAREFKKRYGILPSEFAGQRRGSSSDSYKRSKNSMIPDKKKGETKENSC